MRASHIVAFLTLVLATGLSLSCTAGNDSADMEAAVILGAEVRQGPADVDVSVPIDVTIGQLQITSKAKSPGTVLSQQQDVHITEWVVTCTRTDGGTVASPVWRNYYTVYVPAGSSATLQNYRIFPSEYFLQPPLNQLFPENGGLDKETGQRNIRQRLTIELFGKTVSGERVTYSFPVNLNFFYVTP
ncbi:MAG: hypothetical protein ACOY3Y_19255 [Acidobacteriota bacterium]